MTCEEFLKRIAEINTEYRKKYAEAGKDGKPILILQRFAELQALISTYAGPLDPKKVKAATGG